MALFADVTNEAIKRVGTAVPAANDYSCTFWFKATAAAVSYQNVFLLSEDYAVQNVGTGIYGFLDLGVYNLGFTVYNGGGTVDGSDPTVDPVVGKWNHVAYTREGTAHKFYINGILASTATKDVSADGYADVSMLADGFGSEPNQVIQYFREWNDRVLTATEIIAEANSPTNVSATDLWTDTPLVSDLLDDSGNAHTWTAVGSPSFITGPLPLPITNTTDATAFDIGSLTEIYPVVKSYVQIVRVAATTPSSWFSYTPASIPANVVIGAYWLGTTTYLPGMSVLVGTPGSLTTYKYISNFVKRPLEIPIDSIQTYFIRMVANAGNPANAALYLEFYNAPNPVTSPAGSIFINDAVDGFQAGIFDPSNLDLQQFRAPISGGDDGYKLANGQMILEDRATIDSRIYDAQLNFIASVPHYTTELLSGNKVDKFVIGELSAGTGKIHTINQDTGVTESTVDLGVMTQFHQMTVDEIINTVYVVNTKLNGAITAYNAVTGAVIGTFATGVAGFNTGELLWLNGNTLLAAYSSNTVGTDGFIRHYDCDTGTILNTYPLPDNGLSTSVTVRGQIHLADPWPNFDPQLTFHVWYKYGLCKSRFKEIRLSDGVVLATFDRDNFFGGAYQCDSSDPADRFGHSASCTLLITTEEIPPLTPGETGTLIVQKVTVGGDTQSFDFEVTGDGLTPFSLADGDDTTFIDLVPNSGYGVTETPVAGFGTTYNVSNGSPHDNITIGPGETVTVTVTNSPSGQVEVTKITVGILTTLKFLFELSGNGITTSTAELANGESFTFENIPAAEGYTLSETQLAPGWQITNVIVNGSAGELSNIPVAADTTTVVVVTNTFTPTEGSGIYFVEPAKRNDTLWRANNDTKIVKIPDPQFRTSLLGE